MSTRRESHEMRENDWLSLERVAANVNAVYSGKPSWRRLMLKIARGEIKCEPTDLSPSKR